MRILFPGLVFFVVYALVARWYFVCEVRNRCAEQEVIASRPLTLEVTHGSAPVLEGYEQLWFAKDSIRAEWTSGTQRFFDELAAYLAANTSLELSIAGRYLLAEEYSPSGFFENVGLARAAHAGLQLEKRGVSAQRISLAAQRVEQDSLTEPVVFELHP